MLVPLIFQRAPYLTAALLTLSQPRLFSSLAAGGGDFPQPQPSVGVGQGWVTQWVAPEQGPWHWHTMLVVPCSTDKLSPCPARAWGHPDMDPDVGLEMDSVAQLVLHWGIVYRYSSHRAPGHRTPAHHTPAHHTLRRHPPHPTELFISLRACLAASSSISKHQAN